MVRLSPRVRVSRRGWLKIWIKKLLFGTFKGGVPQFLHTIRNSLAPNNPKSNFVRFSVWYSEGSSLRLVCSKSWTKPVHSHLQNPKINKEFCTNINIFCFIWQYYSEIKVESIREYCAFLQPFAVSTSWFAKIINKNEHLQM